VTFLFTDLEGSTRLWQEHPEAMRSALARHDEIVRDAIEAQHGHVVKTTGDGFHAAFAAAHDAVDAAVGAQRALTREQWEDTPPLVVRMGIHTGPAEQRDGDYYGTAVNRAARLMSAAHGGQIVLSLATEELVQEAGFELLDLGEHNLRDLARAERVFQVVADGLARDFPPLQSLDAIPRHLPLQTTSFVGREADVAAIGGALGAARLVTLTGVGGVGKTRLSLEVAAEFDSAFAHGVWFCELAAAGDVDAMTQVVVSTLGVPPLVGTPLERSLLEFLRARSMLLVLDNCEHLLDEVSELAATILRECPEVRILATSREGLGVPGEQMVAVRSLATPRADDSFEAIARSAAVELFAARATSARAGFALEAANAPAIAEICRRLDGIPLAIELAAARVATMNPTDIAAHIDERFRLLSAGRRSGIDRHQTLRATVDWSYSLLQPQERAVFDRLGVFSGGFDAASAVAVAAGDDVEPWDVHDALTSLVAKSMVVLDDSVDGEARYTMLETLRVYALERLDEQDDTETWRRRHARRYAELAAEWGDALVGRDELPYRRRLRRELDNIRAAVTWALEQDDPDDQELGVRIVVALAYEVTLDRGNNFGSWAEHALDRVTRWSPGERAAVLGAATQASLHRGDFVTALERAEAAVAETVPGAQGNLLPYVSLGSTLNFIGRSDDAVRSMAVAKALFDAAETTDYERWNVLCVSATFRATSNDPSGAREEAEASLRLARRIGNPSALAIALGTLAIAALADDPPTALAASDESRRLTAAGASDVVFTLACATGAAARAVAGEVREALALVLGGLRHSFAQRDTGSLNFTLAVGMAPLLGDLRPEILLTWMRALDLMFPESELNVVARRGAAERAATALGHEEYTAVWAALSELGVDATFERLLLELDQELERHATT